MMYRVLALSIVLGLFAATAQAQDDSAVAEYKRNGLYVGLAGTYAIEDLQHTGAQSVDNSLGVNLRFGYRFRPYLAAELELERIINFDFNTPNIFEELDVWVLTANAKAFGLTGRVQPFVLVGMGVMRTDFEFDDESGFAARLGGGVDLYASSHFVVSLDVTYVLGAGSVSDTRYISLGWGLHYRF